MPAKFIDRTGLVFGDWTVLEFVGRDKCGQAKWLCLCSCGNTKQVVMNSLQQKRSTSCGCKAPAKRAEKNTKHGMGATRTYKSWHAMLDRVQGKGGHESYPQRSIGVCEQWMSFENFYADMGDRPAGKSLDRIDNSLGYSKENCRWASGLEQANNKSNNVILEHDGVKMTIAETARHYNIGISCFRHRLRKGMSVAEAISGKWSE